MEWNENETKMERADERRQCYKVIRMRELYNNGM
jgi:hypothetical protein